MPEDSQLPPYKVVVLGESSVGKTSLVHRFTLDKYDAHTSNTIGAAYITKIFSSRRQPERKIRLEIWDTAGQERYRSLTPMYYRNANAALVCFDLNNFEHSFKTAKYWIEQLELNNAFAASNKIDIRFVGTKADLATTQNSPSQEEEINQYIKEQKGIRSFNKTSSKENSGVLELFEEIVDDIDEAYIEKYYSELKDSQKAGVVMNTRRTSSTCC
ncbi:YPT53 [Candida oxycetoniae]|uniref:YPT53 n=1 Tax=Candida oxycetoniae TaxID=497107 RepID=A0AAI9X004_9ASCO|nr:YPT53 [Candida oxycetoniae]KAI3406430.2 YPT53 [Candida oxycetoniae]